MHPRISIRGSVRPSVGQSVRPSVCLSVGPTVTRFFFYSENEELSWNILTDPKPFNQSLLLLTHSQHKWLLSDTEQKKYHQRTYAQHKKARRIMGYIEYYKNTNPCSWSLVSTKITKLLIALPSTWNFPSFLALFSLILKPTKNLLLG